MSENTNQTPAPAAPATASEVITPAPATPAPAKPAEWIAPDKRPGYCD